MSMKTTCGETGNFPMTIGLHQALGINPYLFTLIIDELIAQLGGDTLVYVVCK